MTIQVRLPVPMFSGVNVGDRVSRTWSTSYLIITFWDFLVALKLTRVHILIKVFCPIWRPNRERKDCLIYVRKIIFLKFIVSSAIGTGMQNYG